MDEKKYEAHIDHPEGVVIGENNTINIYHGIQVSAPQHPLPDAPWQLWNVPYPRNPFFTGREELLTHLAATLRMGPATALTQPQAISGLGGIGKTQIAVEYAYRSQADYQAVFWVRADTRENIVSDFVNIAELLQLPEKEAQEHQLVVNAVKEWLRTHTKWLLILDNADDLSMARDIIPMRHRGHLLLTTRAQAMGHLAQRIEVDTMPEEAGILFLLRRVGRINPNTALDHISLQEREMNRDLVQVLGGLPLALDQAGAYIEETGCGISDYLDRYRSHHDKLLQRRGRLAVDHPDSVTTTFLLSFEKVKQVNPVAAQLLQLCAFLYPDAIPEELLFYGVPELGTELQALTNDPIAMDEAIEALRSYSLIRRTPGARLLFIHRLVQEVLRDTMNEEESRQWAERVIRILYSVFPDPEKIEMWSLCQRYLSQMQVCMFLIKHWHLQLKEGTQLLNQVGYYLQHAHALYTEAEAFYTLALSIDVQTFGPEHPNIIPYLNNLAEVYRIQGQYTQAEPLYQQSLALRVQHFGRNHPSIAHGLNNLGTFYSDQGKYAEAVLYHQQALAIREEILGTEHLDIACSLNNLAEIYRMQDKYDQAEALYLKALGMSKRVLANNHLYVATILNNLAVLYSSQNKYYEAEPLYKESFSITEQILGLLHPDTAINLIGLAEIYIHQSKYEQAEELIQKSLLIFKQSLGPNHFYMAQCLHNLGWLYYVQGRYIQAEACYQQALALYQQYPELKYPHLAETFHKLADLYKAQERYEEAEAFYEQALPLVEQALGQYHPRVGGGYHNLGWLCYQQKKYDKAESLYQHALTIFEPTLGTQHSDIAMCLNHLAALYRDQGKYAEAEPLYLQVLTIRKQVFGSEHPETALAMNNLALLFYMQSKYEEAEPLYKRALSICEQTLGFVHLDVGICSYNLAQLYCDQGRYDEAELLYQRVLYIRKKSLGQEHPKVTDCLINYSALLRKMGRVNDATSLEKQLQRPRNTLLSWKKKVLEI